MMAQQGGAIVNVGAAAADKADAGMGPYAASKAAVAKLTESLAAELSGTDLTVNAILPTIIDTPINRVDVPGEDFSRWVSAEDIAEVATFLASSGARCISGACIPVSVVCSPLAMQTLSAELIGVASEQSGEVIGGASSPGQAGNGTRSVCAEDSAGSRHRRLSKGSVA